MSKHTPTPWIVVYANERVPLPGGPPIAIHRADEPWKQIGAICEIVAQGDGTYDPEVTKGNAELIARAVNAHADLVAALEAIKAYDECDDVCESRNCERCAGPVSWPEDSTEPCICRACVVDVALAKVSHD